MKLAKLLFAILFVGGVCFAYGCDDDVDSAEDVGEKVDDAADEAADKVEDAADDMEDAVDDAADKTDAAVEGAAEGVGDKPDGI